MLLQVGAERYNLFKGCPRARTATMVLRGGSEQFIDEAERSLHDAIMIVRRAMKNASVVPGGGAIDMQLSRQGLAESSLSQNCLTMGNVFTIHPLLGDKDSLYYFLSWATGQESIGQVVIQVVLANRAVTYRAALVLSSVGRCLKGAVFLSFTWQPC